ncbi:uncharacterized protein BO80DRAFT_503627 [Aspergillus ibericus CBS 121593]|uniref:Uncharacterized protein n=1 Tax=Aspergillus ibericus CBS 121593 TaxID=1448316 RepID=A0A395GWN8_9EURO|nr:hypothetical protein BO80DRAFT_503627 [Aspergillus ibericus CBS 121593]RAK99097.1 hypothetical protein BO80DRAFT_503627 [Aspergillus ibericus CBS 121593]
MLNLKVFAVAVLLLSSQAFAGRIVYKTKYSSGGVDRKGGDETKNAGRITDEQRDTILKDIGTWSENKISASVHELTDILTVRSAEVETKLEATTANQNAEHLVKQHI